MGTWSLSDNMYGYDNALSFVTCLSLNMNRNMKNRMITQQIQNFRVSLHHSSLLTTVLCCYGISNLSLTFASGAEFLYAETENYWDKRISTGQRSIQLQEAMLFLLFLNFTWKILACGLSEWDNLYKVLGLMRVCRPR